MANWQSDFRTVSAFLAGFGGSMNEQDQQERPVLVSWQTMGLDTINTYCLRNDKWFVLDKESPFEAWIGPFDSLQQAIDAS